jgi:hypothetical protein
VLVQLAPGDADDAPAVRHKRAVAGAVLLEVPPGGVDAVAVELGHEARLEPDGVDLGAVVFPADVDAVVRPGAGEPVGVEEGEERDLEVAPGDGPADLVAVLQDLLECGRPSSSRMARDEGVEGVRAREASDLRLGDRALEVPRSEDLGQVEQGPGDRGDRDAPFDRDLVAREGDAVALDAGDAASRAERSPRPPVVRCRGSPKARRPSGG